MRFARHTPMVVVLAGAVPAAGQQPDTAQGLPELRVTVTRSVHTAATAGLAVSLIDSAALRRGRSAATLGEALAFVPGVMVRDRGDPSQDLRLTIRGAGARANFGVRGVRVLVDGVPATLPDGQTPLTAVNLLLADRIEVARGPLAALHGNGSLGIVSIETAARPTGNRLGQAGLQSGSDGTTSWHATAGAGGNRLGGLVSASGTTSDGWREHSAAEQRRLSGALEWRPTTRSTLTLRAARSDDPVLDSPGALTISEASTDPGQANPNSVRRNAGKHLEQTSLSLGWRHRGAGALRFELTGWVLDRDLSNPIAAPAPPPADPDEGVWIGIDRRVVGVRTSVGTALGSRVALVAGLDLQRMVDDRTNRRHRAGEVFGAPFLDQQERITEVGPFVQVSTVLSPSLLIRAGVRHDRVAFAVTDNLDPATSGSRTMAAWNAGAALAYHRGPVELWIGGGTAFETPTTTELANRPDGGTGLNTVLEPARTLSLEVGVRRHDRSTRLEAVAWRATTSDAITAISELGGRSFFANVGGTRTLGLEMSAAARLWSTVEARIAATWIDARFDPGAVAADGADLADNRLPGVLPFTARIGLTARPGSVVLDIDHALASGVWADDGNTLRVEGWGAGVTDAHVRWQLTAGAALTGAVRNIFDVGHVAGIVVNGGFGRVAEPGRPRSVMIGGEVALRR